ncbi:MAG: xanthine dehydrogenase family protein molybdopterin-binding subunit [Geminicoccaceae bacterium]|nr:MAG: xanthine dehydrogenase family protein molybdopterin-binding subunit [Geminicoccaceae bacterium]
MHLPRQVQIVEIAAMPGEQGACATARPRPSDLLQRQLGRPGRHGHSFFVGYGATLAARASRAMRLDSHGRGVARSASSYPILVLPMVEAGSRDATAPKVGRIEDARLVRGAGCYVADLHVPDALHVAFRRSEVAHGTIDRIDVDAAKAVPGVLLVATGRDLQAAGVRPIPWEVLPPGAPTGAQPGDPAIAPMQPAAATDRVRHVGEILAMVVATSAEAARDAVELIDVDLTPLPAVVDLRQAVGDDAPTLWPDWPHNVAFTLRRGQPDLVEQRFAAARHVARIELVNPRQAGVALEPRGYLAAPLDHDRWVLHATAGKPHNLRDTLAKMVLGIAPERLVVRTGDIGGGFGVKNALYPETVLVLWTAMQLGRPVRWIGDRTESFLADIAGRDQVNHAELALDADGRFLALRVRTLAGLGSYLAQRGVIPPSASAKITTSVYAIEAVDLEVKGVFTNQVPTSSFRGAGQPEFIYLLERLIDQAAAETGHDPAALRSLNLVPPGAMPYATAAGTRLDGGDFEAVQQRSLELADRAGFAARAARSAARGRLRGWGMAQCLEACGGGKGEAATVVINPDGRATVALGTQSSGQGHETVFAGLVAEALGLPPDQVDLIQGDTDRVATGNGTSASRSLTVGGSASVGAARSAIDAGRPLAADLLEAAAADVDFDHGHYRIRGTDRSVGLAEVAAEAAREAPADGGLQGEAHFVPDNFTFPHGCHVAEVEIDPETGSVTLVRYTLVQDVGRAVHPTIVRGQLHGGLVMGIGQALSEAPTYDAMTGQLLAASLVDYAVPRADRIPDLSVELIETPARHNPLGAKGVGEAGTTGAPPAVMNAVLDALRPLGVDQLDMPATPDRVWAAIQAAKEAGR